MPTSWLTLDAGIRLVHYGGLLSENAADPRVGGGIHIPHLGWTVHGYYAYYYQPPPLDSLSGPSLDYALTQGVSFTPLPGERDIQHDVGLDRASARLDDGRGQLPHQRPQFPGPR